MAEKKMTRGEALTKANSDANEWIIMNSPGEKPKKPIDNKKQKEIKK